MQSDDEDKVRIPLCVMCGKHEVENLESNDSYDLVDRCKICKPDCLPESVKVFIHSILC